jgi:SAM-dependent methyltransferase
MTRKEKILSHIEFGSQTGIEIGPLDNPIVTRDSGNIRYVDHASTEELREKCEAWGTIDTSKIVDVDYVWGNKKLNELTAGESPFDYVIASHVAEHVPDFIGWLKEIRSVLKTGGILSLAVPDKRFTYDYFRQLTVAADMIEAYLVGSRKPSPKQVFDYYAAFVRRNGEFSWKVCGLEHELSRENTIQHALEVAQDALENGLYVDVHCWVFTELSFMELLKCLAELDLFDYKVAGFYGRAGAEFFVSLEALDPHLPPDERRKVQNASFYGALKRIKSPLNRPLFDYSTWKIIHMLRIVKKSFMGNRRKELRG